MNENEDENYLTGRIASYGKDYFNNKISSLGNKQNDSTTFNISKTNLWFSNNETTTLGASKTSKNSTTKIKIGLNKKSQYIKTIEKKKFIPLETENDKSIHCTNIHIPLTVSLPVIMNSKPKQKMSKLNMVSKTTGTDKTNSIESQTNHLHNRVKNKIQKPNTQTNFESLKSLLMSKKLKVSGAFVPQNSSLSSKIFSQKLSYFEPSLTSTIGNTTSYIKAFASNRYKGLYTEDGICSNLLVLNVASPSYAAHSKDIFWPTCSIFGIYDGHKRGKCAEFLRDNLHQNILRNHNFPKRIENAIKIGFENTENAFLKEKALNLSGDTIKDKSGSSALLAFIVNNYLYVASLGDSVAMISYEYLTRYEVISSSHVFRNESERHRVELSGGKFRTLRAKAKGYSKHLTLPCYEVVVPGKIKTTRSIGDAEAKLKKFGGKDNVIIPTPEVNSIKINDDMDFIFIGNYNLFQTMTHNDILQCVRIALNEPECYDEDKGEVNNHKVCGKAVDLIIKTAQMRNAFGSLSGILVFLREFDDLFDDDFLDDGDDDIILRRH